MTSSCEGAVEGLLSLRKERFKGLELAIPGSVKDVTDLKAEPSNVKFTDDGKAEADVPFVEIGLGMAYMILKPKREVRGV